MPGTRPILVLEQEPTLRGAGRIGRVLAARGAAHRLVPAYAHDLDAISTSELAAVIPLGGAAHAWDVAAWPHLGAERRLLARCVEDDVPVLGVCLGGQVLALALGADVHPAAEAEIGWLDVDVLPEAVADPLLGPVGERFRVYQWHHDVFELPAGATRLATSARAATQAYRLGSAWGVQFHPEVDPVLFAAWLQDNPGICERSGVDGARFLEEITAGSARDGATLERLVHGFVDVVEARA